MKLSAEKAMKYRLYYPILLVFAISMFVYAFVTKDNLFAVWSTAGSVAIIVYFLLLIKKPHYFSMETTHSKIIIRFYNPHPFLTKFKSIQIPIQKFYEYEITEKLGGYSRSLKLKIKDKGKTGEYPALSISLLNKNQLDLLKKELDSIIKMNKFK